VAEQNPLEEPVHEQDQVSTTDPDSTYATKGGTPARLGYYDNNLVDNHSCVIVGLQAPAARMSQETVAAQDMLTCLLNGKAESRFCRPPLSRTETRKPAACSQIKRRSAEALFQHPRLIAPTIPPTLVSSPLY
jgi:hypothetical protein